MIETRPKKGQERALLIGLEQAGVSKWDLRDSMEELRELANSAGAEVVDTVTQKLPRPTAPYYIGKGKAESIKDSFQHRHVTSVIFDDELSPRRDAIWKTFFREKCSIAPNSFSISSRNAPEAGKAGCRSSWRNSSICFRA